MSEQEKIISLVRNIEKVIIGKHDVVIKAVTALLSGGHILLEDVPGVGKTMLARALAKSISGDFKRIQFTADLLPSDITGVNIYQQKTGEFSFRQGPVFSNILLGDEINRATPRTQSSLLEAMEENQVTIDGELHALDKPFMVIATQNPIELEGTYPLPFAQMDRFIVRLQIGYVDARDERQMLQDRLTSSPIDELGAILDCQELLVLQKEISAITVSEDVLDFIVAIVRRTRDHEHLAFGASPRASLDMMRYSQATAYINKRDYVSPDDVKFSAPVVLGHRVIVKRGTRHGSMQSDDFIHELLGEVPVPV
ncbi:MAG: MoxR family ATPase [Lentisphaeria bacterium]|nr:MoxR family ATPase [Lentisphaeria bacterium]NQZ69284.1 MoxR family ATPase [Lentisphaeria bacterium]